MRSKGSLVDQGAGTLIGEQFEQYGKTQHAVLLELFTNQGTGTLIHK